MTHPYVFAGLPESKRVIAILGIKSDDHEYIMKSVASVFGITVRDLVSKTRTRLLVEARCIAIGLILKVDPEFGLKKMGKVFGGRDHSTIIYNRRLYEDLYGRDKSFTEKVNKVLGMI